MHEAKRLRVLICAYACDPTRGSEEGVGWNWTRALAEYCDLTVITADRFGSRTAIEGVLHAEPELARHMEFLYLPDFTDRLRGPIMRLVWRYFQPVYYYHYDRWMRKAGRLAEQVLGCRAYNIAHQLTMIGYREPGYLWKLPIPFIWGPVGGTQNVPWPFIPSLGFVEGGRHACRNLVNRWQFRHHARFQAALHRASGVISTASDTASVLRDQYGVDSIVVPASFTFPGIQGARIRSRSAGKPLNLVFSGMHLSRKGLPFALEALARLNRSLLDWHLHVIGSGALTGEWRRFAERLDVTGKTTWHGQVNRGEALRLMAASDVFVFPSMLEGSPAVVAEALSLGLPVITTDQHGMADYVDKSCGIKVSTASRDMLVTGIAEGVQRLCAEPGLLQSLSVGALRKAEEYSSMAQIARVVAMYNEVISSEPQGREVL